jgi:hypothetical protein
MKISSELAEVLRKASEEVDGWPKWKRSLDPIGDKAQKLQKEESKSGASGQLGDKNAA